MDILLFGITKDIVGQSKLTVPQGKVISTVAELKGWLTRQYPAMANLSSLAVAVDSEYAEDCAVIDMQSEVALIPPVSGG